MVYSFGMEGERKKKSQSPWLYSSQYSISIMWMERTQKSSFWALYLSLWLLEKTSVVQMWDGKSGLHWHRPCGCFGAGAHSAVGYRCLLSSINVASMWNHGIRSATQRSTPLIVWEITPSWRNSFLKGWNTFLNIRSFPFRGVEPGKRGLMTLDWAPGTVSSGGYSLGTLNWKLKKKKSATLKPKICESQILCCACSREFGTCKPLDGFFGDARWKAWVVVVVIGSDSGWNVPTNFNFPELSLRLVGPEKTIWKRKKTSIGLGGALFVSSLTKTVFSSQKYVSRLTHVACASNRAHQMAESSHAPFREWVGLFCSGAISNEIVAYKYSEVSLLTLIALLST